MLVWGQVGFVEAVICLEKERRGRVRETPLAALSLHGWSKQTSWPLRHSEPSLFLLLYEPMAAKEASPQGPAACSAWAWGLSTPGPTLYENPQPRATGCQQMVPGATSELTGTPREVTVGGAEGGAKDHRHTTGILLLVGTLSDKPPSSSTSPVAARKKKTKTMLDSTNRSRLPPGARPWACQPGAAWPTSLPRQTQPDLWWRGPSTLPDTAAPSPRRADTTPCHQPETQCGGIHRLSWESELSLFGELRGQLKLKISIKAAPP